MRVPTNSFDASDKALCRAHGRAVAAPPKVRRAVHSMCAAMAGVPTRALLDPEKSDAYWQWQNEVHAPAKPAAPQPCQAPAWRRGSDIPKSERVGLWHVRNDRYDKEPCNADHASEFWFQVAEYAPAAPDAKFGDPYDESKYASQGDAYVSAKQPEPAKPVRQVQATYIVCIKAHISTFGNMLPVGKLLCGQPRMMQQPDNWLSCDKDGWVSHERGSACSVRCLHEVKLANGEVGLNGSWSPDATDDRRIVAWRPTGGAA